MKRPRRTRARPPAPAGELLIRNRQRTCAVALRPLRAFTLAALAAQSGLRAYELGLHLVGAAEMAALNATFLNHAGATDVITFDHAEARSGTCGAARLHGELFLCVDEAVRQARVFRTSWQAELARYVLHGLLHLRGYDDLTPAARRRMKRVEDRLLRQLARRHPLSRLGRPARIAR